MRHFYWVVALCIVLTFGCQSSTPPPNTIHGTWEVITAEAFGEKIADKGEAGMRITFAEGKAKWDFRTDQGWQSFDGLCRIDPEGHSGWIDLGEPKSQVPSRVSLGIYKIEGGMLRINMDKERPSDFDKPALAKLTFKPFKK